MKNPTVALIGPGSLGIMYGEFFERKLPPENFYFVEDAGHKARHEKIRYSVNGKECRFVFKTPEEVSSAPDLILVATKYSGLQDAAKIIAKIAGPETVIISVLNGISSEEILQKEVPQAAVIPCIAQKMDAFNKSGAVTSGHFGELCIGITKEESSKQPALKKLIEIFNGLGMPYVLEDDIRRRMWCKWMLNVGVNQTLMTADKCFRDIHVEGPLRERMIGAMREILELSKLENVGMTEQDFKDYLAIIDGLNPDGMPSMRQDRLAKRKSEVELFAGTAMTIAARHGVQVPVNSSLYEEVQKIESDY